MTRRRFLRLLIAVAVVAAGIGVWRWQDRFAPNLLPLYHAKDGASADLTADRERMWETRLLEGNAGPMAGPHPKGSTYAAIHAASRVFNTVDLVGKTRQDVIALLGDPRTSNDSVYNFPFWRAPTGAMVYRFDTGDYRWQFNVLFGLFGRVTEVRRHWIY